MIEMAFYGRHIFGISRQKKSERAVVDAWYRYLDNLGLEAAQVNWETRNNLFIDLIATMAVDVGLRFDRNQITKSVYSPIAHGEAEKDEITLRKQLIAVMNGDAALKMAVTSFPVDTNALAAQIELQQKMAAALGDGALKVEMKP